MKFKIHQQNGLDLLQVAKIKKDIQDSMVYYNKFSSVLNLEFSQIMLKMLLENYKPKRNNQKISYQNNLHIKLLQIHYKEIQIQKKYFQLLVPQRILNSHMNMLSVVGSNGNNLNNNKIGITFLEFKLFNHQQISFQEIEHWLLLLVKQMEELFTYQHIHSLIQKALVIQMLPKIFHTMINIKNGSLFILDTLNHKRKLLLKYFGKIHKTNKIMITLNTFQFLNSLSLLVKINTSQDLMVKLLQFLSMLEKVHSNLMQIYKEKEILSILMLERRNQLVFNQKLIMKQIQLNKRNHTKYLMMLLLMVLLDQIQVKKINQLLMKHKKEMMIQLNMVMDIG